MIKCHVEFNNGISKNFYSDKNETEILKKILEFCERYGVETVEGQWSHEYGKKWNRDADAGTMNGEKTYCPLMVGIVLIINMEFAILTTHRKTVMIGHLCLNVGKIGRTRKLITR